jgi:hypothetical protein
VVQLVPVVQLVLVVVVVAVVEEETLRSSCLEAGPSCSDEDDGLECRDIVMVVGDCFE